MKSKRQSIAWAMMLAVTAMSFTGCDDNANSSSSSETADSVTSTTQNKTTEQQTKTTSIEAENISYIKNNFIAEYDNDDFTNQYDTFDAEITLKGDTASINGNTKNVSIEDSLITISKGGVYRISGKLLNGQIAVIGNEKVKLYLDSADITSNNGPAIYCSNEKRTIITLADGTENHLADSNNYSVSSYPENFDPSALYAEDKLTINGTGTLIIDGNYANGIVSRNDLKITDGNIKVTALNNGIKGKDSVAVCGGTISVNAGNDGIKSTEKDDSEKGWVEINGGTISIESVRDGIQAETNLYITDGTLNIKTTGDVDINNKNEMSPDNFNFSNNDNMMDHEKFKNFQNNSFPEQSNQKTVEAENIVLMINNTSQTNDTNTTNSSDETTETEDNKSSKGIKACDKLQITGGNITIESTDHSVHSGGETKISNGILQLTSLYSKGISSHGNMTISGDATEIVIANATEGIESKAKLQIENGRIRILNATDDGINTGGGNSMGGFGMNFSKNETSTSNSDSSHDLSISGGTIFISADGDGIDSNGSISITDGTIIVSGPVSGGDGSLDSETGITITGGNVMALSSRGMMEYPEENCMVSTSINASAGDLISVIDSDGNVLTAFKTKKDVSDIIYFNNNTNLSICQLNIGGKYDGTLNEDGYAIDGKITGGTIFEWSNSADANISNSIQDGRHHGMPFGGEERPSFDQTPDGRMKPPEGNNMAPPFRENKQEQPTT